MTYYFWLGADARAYQLLDRMDEILNKEFDKKVGLT